MVASEFIQEFADLIKDSNGNTDITIIQDCIEFLKGDGYKNDKFFRRIDPGFKFRALAHAYILSERYIPKLRAENTKLFGNYKQSTLDSEEKEDELINNIVEIFKKLVSAADFSYTQTKPKWDESVLKSCVNDVEQALQNIKELRKRKANTDASPTDRKIAYGNIIDKWFKEHVAELYKEMSKPGSPLLVSNESKLTPAERKRLQQYIDANGTCVWTPKGESPASSLLRRLQSYIEYEKNSHDILSADGIKQISDVDTDEKVFTEGVDEGSDAEAVRGKPDKKDTEEKGDEPKETETPENGNVTGS